MSGAGPDVAAYNAETRDELIEAIRLIFSDDIGHWTETVLSAWTPEQIGAEGDRLAGVIKTIFTKNYGPTGLAALMYAIDSFGNLLRSVTA